MEWELSPRHLYLAPSVVGSRPLSVLKFIVGAQLTDSDSDAWKKGEGTFASRSGGTLVKSFDGY